jgi:hypothetical protein
MTEPAKDEAELVQRVADTLREYVPHINFHGEAIRAIAAIRAAGWAVVPVALMDQLAEKFEELCDEYYYDRKNYADVKRRYENDMKTPSAIRAMLAAAPGAKHAEPVCVNAHDRCYGGAGGPCPYCEIPAAPGVKP